MYSTHTFQALELYSDMGTHNSTRVEDMVDFILLLISNSAMSMARSLHSSSSNAMEAVFAH